MRRVLIAFSVTLIFAFALDLFWIKGRPLVSRSSSRQKLAAVAAKLPFASRLAAAIQSQDHEQKLPLNASEKTAGREGASAKRGDQEEEADPMEGAIDPQAYKKAPPLSKQEVANVRTLLSTFFQAGRGQNGFDSFLLRLKEAGMKPQLTKDRNSYTGDMIVVRTEEALEGTRYLHAQYFEDESHNKEPFRQHLSFEIRPSPDSLEVLQGLVRELSGEKLGPTKSFRADQWMEWQLGNHSLWAKRLEKEDIANDPFNARTVADIGTIRVAIELIPEEDHSAHD